MSHFSRRAFLTGASGVGLIALGLPLTGCGEGQKRGAASRTLASNTPVATVVMYDLRMEAWSTLGSGQLGFTGTLTAAQIQADQDLNLIYSQDPDGHGFTLTKSDLRKLRRGEKVSVITTEAAGHTHEVRIDALKNRIQGSQGITMPVDPEAAAESFFLALDDAETPRVFAAGSTEMDPDSVAFCAAKSEDCAKDETLWQRMKTYVSSGRDAQFFASGEGVAVPLQGGEATLLVRGKTKGLSAAVQSAFRIRKLP